MAGVPNDLPEGGARYFQEYVEAGGTLHAARAYAIACCDRDLYAKRVRAYTARVEKGDVNADPVNVQVMWACAKSRDAASDTAEKLRAALPAKSADELPNSSGHFND